MRSFLFKTNVLRFCLSFLTTMGILSACSKDVSSFIPPERILIKTSHEVTYDDVCRYATYTRGASTKSSIGEAPSILPICGADQDTLLYLINYDDGWRIISTDKRTPMEIAYSEHGTINMDLDCPPFRAWLNATISDVKKIKQAEDWELAFSSEEIRFHKKAWQKYEEPHRGGPFPIEIMDFVDTLYYSEPVVQLMHMVPSHWDQNAPYNQYCPSKPDGNHYDVGCAGIAGGGLLHFLYKKNGYPTQFNGVPMDSIGVNYSDSLTDSTRVTARYLRSVNDEMNMMYLSGGSAAFPSGVVSFFNTAGYNCVYASYDASIVRDNLLAGNPVLILAFENLLDIPEIPNVFSGHYFIIDGYQTRRDVVAYHYYSIGIDGVPIPYMERFRYEYLSPPYLAFVKMNWGWWSQWVNQTNDGWYALTSSWVTTNGTYDTSRKMFYSFQ